VLLSSWRLNSATTGTSTGNSWGATFVGGSQTEAVVPPCGSGVLTTVLSPGATVTGTVHSTGDCPNATFPLWVWLDGDRGLTIRLTGLKDGDTFRYSGLPAGRHTLGARGLTSPLALAAGGLASHDATFACPGTPDPGSSPSGEPSPTPTPTKSSPSPSTSATRSDPTPTPPGS
jgi:hypothetical protein